MLFSLIVLPTISGCAAFQLLWSQFDSLFGRQLLTPSSLSLQNSVCSRRWQCFQNAVLSRPVLLSFQNVYYTSTQWLHVGVLSPTIDDDDNKCLVDVNSKPRLIECSYAMAKRMKLHWLFTQVRAALRVIPGGNYILVKIKKLVVS